MSLKNTDGVIIKLTDYGESDKIVTFYAPIKGKFSTIAKGAKRSKKRFLNKLEQFTHLNIIYNDRYKLPLVEQVEKKNNFKNLHGNLNRYAAAALLCELLLHWTHENDGDPDIFKALLETFSYLNDTNLSVEKPLVLFLCLFYTRLGFQPDLSACAKCGSLDYGKADFQFHANHGSIICSKCAAAPQKPVPLSIATIKLISQAQKLPFDKAFRLQFPKEAIRQSLNLFRTYGSVLLDREINSWTYIDTE